MFLLKRKSGSSLTKQDSGQCRTWPDLTLRNWTEPNCCPGWTLCILQKSRRISPIASRVVYTVWPDLNLSHIWPDSSDLTYLHCGLLKELRGLRHNVLFKGKINATCRCKRSSLYISSNSTLTLKSIKEFLIKPRFRAGLAASRPIASGGFTVSSMFNKTW